MLKRQHPRIRIGAPPETYPRTPSGEGSFQEKGLLPREHLADQAYLSADLLVPGAASPGRRAREIKKGPRELTLHAQEEHLALVEARRRQQTDEIWERYAGRAGMEGTARAGRAHFGNAKVTLPRPGENASSARRYGGGDQPQAGALLAQRDAALDHLPLALLNAAAAA